MRGQFVERGVSLNAAIKCKRGEAFEIADEVSLETYTGILPRRDLAHACLRRLTMKALAIFQPEAVKPERRQQHGPAQVVRHLRMLFENKLR